MEMSIPCPIQLLDEGRKIGEKETFSTYEELLAALLQGEAPAVKFQNSERTWGYMMSPEEFAYEMRPHSVGSTPIFYAILAEPAQRVIAAFHKANEDFAAGTFNDVDWVLVEEAALRKAKGYGYSALEAEQYALQIHRNALNMEIARVDLF